MAWANANSTHKRRPFQTHFRVTRLRIPETLDQSQAVNEGTARSVKLNNERALPQPLSIEQGSATCFGLALSLRARPPRGAVNPGGALPSSLGEEEVADQGPDFAGSSQFEAEDADRESR